MGGIVAMSSTINASTASGGGVITTADASGILQLQTAGVTGLTIDASQNVMVGTTTPTGKFNVTDTSTNGNPLLISSGQTGTTVRSNSVARFQTTATGRDVYVQFSDNVSNATEIGMLSGATYFCTGATERMRLDASGNLLVGTTSALVTPSRIAVVYPGDTTWGIGFKSSYLTGGGQPCTFINSSNVVIGYIGTNGTATSYITSSDYRLKENIIPIVGALDKVVNLNPVTYIWKGTDNEVGEGFIAHELQAICPLAVSGEKDAVNKDGSIKAQGIDPSKIVALLTAAIKELKAIIDTQNARIEALEAK